MDERTSRREAIFALPHVSFLEPKHAGSPPTVICWAGREEQEKAECVFSDWWWPGARSNRRDRRTCSSFRVEHEANCSSGKYRPSMGRLTVSVAIAAKGAMLGLRVIQVGGVRAGSSRSPARLARSHHRLGQACRNVPELQPAVVRFPL
jgi:hypothetical protein